MKQKLYFKNEKGRYEEYKDPEPPHRNCLFVKNGNKYEPWGMDLRNNWLNEGVWVVTKNNYGTRTSNGKYLNDSYLCLKASDIVEAPSLAELGGYEKLTHYLSENWDKVDKSCVDTMCHSIVGILMQYKQNTTNNE